MQIKELHIKDFRGIRRMEINLHPKLNVLIGFSGAGKSTVLDTLGYLCEPFVRFAQFGNVGDFCRSKNNVYENGYPEHEIRNGLHSSSLEIVVSGSCQDSANKLNNLWFLKKSVLNGRAVKDMMLLNKGSSFYPESSLQEYVDSLTDLDRGIFVYYRDSRSVVSVPINAWSQRSFLPEDTYTDALAQKVNFKEFFEWFRNREDLENEVRKADYSDPQLDCVRRAIGVFCEELTDIRVRRRDPLRMVVTKYNSEVRIEQLSKGEKILLATVGDLSRRLAIAYPTLDDPLHGEAVVLIDELELHLHPQTQRKIISQLIQTFPNCQFILSTNSPIILGEVRSENVIYMSNDEKDGVIAERNSHFEVFGQDTGVLLGDSFDTLDRNESVQKMFDERALKLLQWCRVRLS